MRLTRKQKKLVLKELNKLNLCKDGLKLFISCRTVESLRPVDVIWFLEHVAVSYRFAMSKYSDGLTHCYCKLARLSPQEYKKALHELVNEFLTFLEKQYETT